jgi:hypothetical protein
MEKMWKRLFGTQEQQLDIPVVINCEIKNIQNLTELENLSDKDIISLFDEDYKDVMFDDPWDVCVRQNAYKNGFMKVIKMLKSNNS